MSLASLRVGVLTLDDELRASLAQDLSRSGIECEQWSESPESSVNLLLLDTDGFSEPAEHIRRARAHNAHVLIVATGKDPSPDLLIEMIRLGVFDFLERPPSGGALGARLRALCERITDSRYVSEISHRLRSSESESGQSQAELARQIDRSDEELRSVNRRLQKVVSQLKTVYHMGHDLGENENWSDALDRFLMALVSFMEADGAGLLLFSSHETVLAPRSTFQMDNDVLDAACATILPAWVRHPRSGEVHSLESYADAGGASCLERTEPWCMTLLPLRHRGRARGFLVLEKDYASGFDFKEDFDFLNTLQAIFVEELANASNISELRRLGRFNTKILDNLGSGVITTGVDGTIQYYNVSAREMCPRLHDPRISGDKARVHFDDLFQSRSYGEGFFDRILSSNKDSPVLEVECSGGGDRAFPARLRTARMYDDNLDGTVVVAIFEDLTEQKRMEAEIRRNDRLRVLGQLSARVAHEIRNPLTGIATSAEVLASKLAGDEDKVQFVRAMLGEIHRLDGIIRNLLAFARQPRPHIEECSLNEVVDKVVELLADQASEKGVTVQLSYEDEESLCNADPAQLTQVLLNLVLNSIQACSEGDTVKVEVSSRTAGSASVARIDVIDSGPGVPREIRESLFEPFVTTKTQGSGLGLAISQQIIEDHHGSIRCDFLQKGTRFSIELPQSPDGAPNARRR